MTHRSLRVAAPQFSICNLQWPICNLRLRCERRGDLRGLVQRCFDAGGGRRGGGSEPEPEAAEQIGGTVVEAGGGDGEPALLRERFRVPSSGFRVPGALPWV